MAWLATAQCPFPTMDGEISYVCAINIPTGTFLKFESLLRSLSEVREFLLACRNQRRDSWKEHMPGLSSGGALQVMAHFVKRAPADLTNACGRQIEDFGNLRLVQVMLVVESNDLALSLGQDR